MPSTKYTTSLNFKLQKIVDDKLVTYIKREYLKNIEAIEIHTSAKQFKRQRIKLDWIDKLIFLQLETIKAKERSAALVELSQEIIEIKMSNFKEKLGFYLFNFSYQALENKIIDFITQKFSQEVSKSKYKNKEHLDAVFQYFKESSNNLGINDYLLKSNIENVYKEILNKRKIKQSNSTMNAKEILNNLHNKRIISKEAIIKMLSSKHVGTNHVSQEDDDEFSLQNK